MVEAVGFEPTTHGLKVRYSSQLSYASIYSGATGEIRTPDSQVRSLVLYPTELRSQFYFLIFIILISLGFRHLSVAHTTGTNI